MEEKENINGDKDQTVATTECAKDNSVQKNEPDLTHQDYTQKPAVHKLEVEIYDKISVGEPPYDKIQLQKVNYDHPVVIEASTKKDLKDFEAKLSMCQQTFKVIRDLGPVNGQANVQQHMPAAHSQNACQQQPAQIQMQSKAKPKYYKIGNIEIKDDNGKIYQKQWLKLTDEEMSNFRIVNNKTNAIVALKDKSIEMKKWVLVETSEDTSTTLEENMK